MPLQPLPRSFYERDVVSVARELLGQRLVRWTAEGETSGRIVETEAYLAAGDSACHAARGKTRRNATMFGPPGFLYVYTIHTRHCLNIVAEPEHVAAAVLIRALEPQTGLELMRQRRGREKILDLTRGPGRLCEALDVARRDDGLDVTRGEQFWIEPDPTFEPEGAVLAISPRIGVTSAHELPLRFFFPGNRFVSGTTKNVLTIEPLSGP